MQPNAQMSLRFGGSPLGLLRTHVSRGPEKIRPAPVTGADVRMIERRQHLPLALKAGEAIGIGGGRRRQELERDVPAETRILHDPPRWGEEARLQRKRPTRVVGLQPFEVRLRRTHMRGARLNG
jgi:hypothetical protein